MKNKIIAIFSIVITTINVNAQTPTIEWQHSFGGSGLDEIEDMIQTTDGGYITVGHTSSTNGDVSTNYGNLDVWVVKTDNLGNLVWEKSLGGSQHDEGYSIELTADGGYIIAGTTMSNDGDITTNYGQNDVWVVKLNNAGGVVWEKTYGGVGNEISNSIKQTSDGGYIIAARSNINNGDVTGNNGDYDYWMLKINSSGTLLWQQSYGGTGYDEASAAQETADGGYIITGYSNSNNGDITATQGGYDAWVVKTDNIGNIQWQKSLGGSGSDASYSVLETLNGDFVIAGKNNSNDGNVTANHGGDDFWVVKLNNLGSIVWEKSLGGTGNEYAYSIKQTDDNGYVIAGRTVSIDGDVTVNNGSWDMWVIKLNSAGVLIWEKSLGGSLFEEAKSVIQNSNGDYVVAGFNKSNDGDATLNQGLSDYWIVKLKSCIDNITTSQSICNGDTYQFGTQLLSTAGQYVETFQNLAGCDSIVTLNLTVLPSSNTTINDTICDGDTYQLGTQSLSSAGTYSENFYNQYGCDSIITVNLAIEALPTANITMVGNDLQANVGGNAYQWYFNGTAINGETNQTYTPTQNGDYTVVVISQWGCTQTSAPFTVEGLGLKSNQTIKIKVYPNPSTGVFVVNSSSKFTYQIFNVVGKTILKSNQQVNATTIDLSNYETGLYFLKVKSNNGSVKTIKLIKQ